MLTLNISNTCPNSKYVTKPSFCVQVPTYNKLYGVFFVYLSVYTFLRHPILPRQLQVRYDAKSCSPGLLNT